MARRPRVLCKVAPDEGSLSLFLTETNKQTNKTTSKRSRLGENCPRGRVAVSLPGGHASEVRLPLVLRVAAGPENAKLESRRSPTGEPWRRHGWPRACSARLFQPLLLIYSSLGVRAA